MATEAKRLAITFLLIALSQGELTTDQFVEAVSELDEEGKIKGMAIVE